MGMPMGSHWSTSRCTPPPAPSVSAACTLEAASSSGCAPTAVHSPTLRLASPRVISSKASSSAGDPEASAGYTCRPQMAADEYYFFVLRVLLCK
eukprot:48874-Prorocentrum_minimum.AAC.1